MKIRGFTIIAVALALIVLVGALISQAQGNQSVSNFVLDHVYTNGQMKFHWTTIDGEYDNKIQVKGGNISNVYTTLTVNDVQYSSSTGTTGIIINAISSDPASLSGETLSFRVRVTVCTAENEGTCDSSYTTDWAYLDASF